MSMENVLLQAIYALRAVNPEVIEMGGDERNLRQLITLCRETREWAKDELSARAEFRVQLGRSRANRKSSR